MTDAPRHRHPPPALPPPGGSTGLPVPVEPQAAEGVLIRPSLCTLLEAAEMGTRPRPGHPAASAFAAADRAYRRTRDDVWDDPFFDFTV